MINTASGSLVNLVCFSFAPTGATIYLESCQKQAQRLCLLCWTNNGGIKGWPWWMENGDWSLSPTKTNWHMIDMQPWKFWLMPFILVAAVSSVIMALLLFPITIYRLLEDSSKADMAIDDLLKSMFSWCIHSEMVSMRDLDIGSRRLPTTSTNGTCSTTHISAR